jgi:hypothetical protein
MTHGILITPADGHLVAVNELSVMFHQAVFGKLKDGSRL